MKKNLSFHKMVASGNDFVVIDNRAKLIKDARRFAGKVCAPHYGIGADGVLLLEKSNRAAFKMRIVNSDGSEAEACGNGFRCIARYAHEKLGFPSEFKFESLSGLIQARVAPGKVRVQLAQPRDYRNRAAIDVKGHRLPYSFIDTGVPHVVIFVQGLAKIFVQELGPAIRYHDVFKPKGTNVNFVEVQGPQEIRVRTYERGVEAETLACGTGSTASAIVSTLAGYVKPPVRVHTRGGEVLLIDFKKNGREVRNVTLEGEAQFIFEGTLTS